MLGGGIVGAVISALATIFYGERRAEMLRLRRKHSETLLDRTLRPWLGKYKEICRIGAEYSSDPDTLIAHEPQESSLQFFDDIRSHLKSKYPDIMRSWETLKQATFEHNKKLAIILEDIRNSILKETNLPQYHCHGRAPSEYICPERIAECVYETMAYETRTGEDWFTGRPSVQPLSSGNTMFYQVNWAGSSNFAICRNEDRAGKIAHKIVDIVESPEYEQRIRQAVDAEDMVIRPKRIDFEHRMEDLIESIELGNSLRGKCKHCRKL
jgi:gas vesicle protein